MNQIALSPDSLQLAINLFLTVGSVSLLLSLLNSVLSVVAFFKRPRTIESMFFDIDQRWREEQKQLSADFDDKLEKLTSVLSAQINDRALHRDVTAMESRIATQVESMKRDVGARIDGMHGAIVEQRKTLASLSSDIAGISSALKYLEPKGHPHAD
jgi:uncharacterized protein YeeX (DUF496 family)